MGQLYLNNEKVPSGNRLRVLLDNWDKRGVVNGRLASVGAETGIYAIPCVLKTSTSCDAVTQP